MPREYWKKEANRILKIMLRDISFGKSDIGKILSYRLSEINNPKLTAKVMTYFTQHLRILIELVLSVETGAMSAHTALSLLAIKRENMVKTVERFRKINISLPGEESKILPFIGNALQNVLTARYRAVQDTIKNLEKEKSVKQHPSI